MQSQSPPVCRIETSVMQDFHIEPGKYNIVVNIAKTGDVELIINQDKVFQTLKNHGKIVGSINKKLSELLSQMPIPTDEFAQLNDREKVGTVSRLLDNIIQKRLDALSTKEQKNTQR